ncbi:HlyIII-domain-containing protein [Armillaria gallica]|uniref:HlyIII-domain-containing protein n=1 Tax=Armillaria gallica TaxID=47427 RepID=A0A2H3CY71_ARMGA|nr:HlyIII-domain-containing protein [Armillaria gallica]
MAVRRRLSEATALVPDLHVGVPNLSKTLHIYEAPVWMRDNEYIVSGYRRAQNHWRGCFHSVFGYLHNETVNIHSHLWGAALFLYFLITFHPNFLEPYPKTTWIDLFVFVTFLSSAVFCLGASAFFHTSICHSKEVASRCVAFDYSGIVVLILGSFYPSIYYGLFCSPYAQVTYISLLTTAGLGAAYVVLQPEYARATHRGLRTSVFIGLGLTGIIPVCHALVTHGFLKLFSDMGLNWLLFSGGLYIAGGLLYFLFSANRIPERFSPGMFDYFFSSHQIFHVCVVIAALAHFASISTALDFWHTEQVSCQL